MSKADAVAMVLIMVETCSKTFPEKAASLEAMLKKQAPPDWDAVQRQAKADPKYEESARTFRQVFAGLSKDQLRKACDEILTGIPGGQLPR